MWEWFGVPRSAGRQKRMGRFQVGEKNQRLSDPKKICFFVNLDPNKFSLQSAGEKPIAMIALRDHGFFMSF
jgi:hypothetical protein